MRQYTPQRDEVCKHLVKIDIGVSGEERREMTAELSDLQAGNHTLYLKMRGFQGKATGPIFTTLHLIFDWQSADLALAVNAIAERTQALGVKISGTYLKFFRPASNRKETGAPTANEMLGQPEADPATVVINGPFGLSGRGKADHQPSAEPVRLHTQTREMKARMLRSASV